MTTEREPRESSEDGVTLIELLVYMISASVVMLSLVGIVSTILNTNNTVQSSLAKANQLQVTFKSLQLGIRNSAALQLTSLPQGQLLIAKVYSTDTGNYDSANDTCQAWLFNSALGNGLYTAFFTTKSQMPSVNSKTNWISLSDSIVDSPPALGVLELDPLGIVTLRYTSITREGVATLEVMKSKPRMPNGLVTGSCFN